MTFGLTKEQLEQREALIASLKLRGDELDEAVEHANQVMADAWASVKEAEQKFNTEVDNAQTFIENVYDTNATTLAEKSEKYRDSEPGMSVQEWLEEWTIQLEESDIGDYEPISSTESDAVNTFVELPVTPGHS